MAHDHCNVRPERLEEAERSLEAALVGDPRDPGAHLQLDLVAEKRGEPRAAAAEYENALQSDPGSYEAHFNLAKLLGQLGREAEMVEQLERSIAANPGFALGTLYLANAVLEWGDLDHALTLAMKGLSLEPEPSLAALGHFILADVYNRMGRKNDAARELAEASSLEAASPGSLEKAVQTHRKSLPRRGVDPIRSTPSFSTGPRPSERRAPRLLVEHRHAIVDLEPIPEAPGLGSERFKLR